MGALILAASWVVFGLLSLFALTVLWKIWDGTIDLKNLISESNGDASMSRFQLLIFTFVIAASLFLVIAAHDPQPAFPDDIPAGVLALLGISGSTYAVAKAIQTSGEATDLEHGKDPDTGMMLGADTKPDAEGEKPKG